MALIDARPGTLNIALTKSKDFAKMLDFSIGLVGYTAAASLVSVVTGGTEASFTTTFQDATAGQVNIALTATQTAALNVGTYRLKIDWTEPGGVQTPVLAGFVEVVQ